MGSCVCIACKASVVRHYWQFARRQRLTKAICRLLMLKLLVVQEFTHRLRFRCRVYILARLATQPHALSVVDSRHACPKRCVRLSASSHSNEESAARNPQANDHIQTP